MHAHHRFADPTVDDAVQRLWQGILTEDHRPRERKLAILEDGLRGVIAAMDRELHDAGRFPDPYVRTVNARDRAMVPAFYCGALRRGEIASLDAEQIAAVARGVNLDANVSDLARRHREVTLEYGHDPATCPVIALQSWPRGRSSASSSAAARWQAPSPRPARRTRYGWACCSMPPIAARATTRSSSAAVCTAREPSATSSQPYARPAR